MPNLKNSSRQARTNKLALLSIIFSLLSFLSFIANMYFRDFVLSSSTLSYYDYVKIRPFIFWGMFSLGMTGIVFGIMGLKQIVSKQEKGKLLAISAIVLGAIMALLALWMLYYHYFPRLLAPS